MNKTAILKVVLDSKYRTAEKKPVRSRLGFLSVHFEEKLNYNAKTTNRSKLVKI